MMAERAGMRFAAAGHVTYKVIAMTLEEIKQAIEKLPTEELFELDRRLSARYPTVWKTQVARDAEDGKIDAAFAEIDEELKRGEVRPL